MIDPAGVQGEQNFSDTLSVGHQYILEPNFSNTKNSFYQWSVEGAIVSYDSIFKYIPATRGKHLMEISIENRGVPAWVNYDVFTWGPMKIGFILLMKAGLNASGKQ